MKTTPIIPSPWAKAAHRGNLAPNLQRGTVPATSQRAVLGWYLFLFACVNIQCCTYVVRQRLDRNSTHPAFTTSAAFTTYWKFQQNGLKGFNI